jgi:hypothetical protein
MRLYQSDAVDRCKMGWLGMSNSLRVRRFQHQFLGGGPASFRLLASADKSLRSGQSILFDATLRGLARYRRESIRKN